MPLEATVICVDNSDYSRNADVTPNRLDAQQDAANLIAMAKVRANPENSIGLLTLAGRAYVTAAPTSDVAVFLHALHSVPANGVIDLIRGVQTAQLALKHRLNRNQKQRIVLFICSPINATESQLELLGKQLKKNNVSIDIVSFGEIQANSKLVHKLWSAANSNDTSHLLEVVDAGSTFPSQVANSPLLDAVAPSNSADRAALEEFGVDPSADPELYMALRLSLEEERNRVAREEATRQPNMAAGPGSSNQPNATANIAERVEGDSHGLLPREIIPDATGSSAPPSEQEILAMDIDEELRIALLLSLQDYNAQTQTTQNTNNNQPLVSAEPDVAAASAADDQQKSEEVFKTPLSSVSGSMEDRDDAPGGGQAYGSPQDSPTQVSNSNSTLRNQIAPGLRERLERVLPGVDFANPEVLAAMALLENGTEDGDKNAHPEDDNDGKEQ